MSRLVGRAIGGVANGVIKNVDVDEVVQRISINEVLERVDWNELLDHVDLDQVLDRIDMDKLVDRLPVQKIVDKSNLKEIIARSSAGIFSNLLDVIRAQAIRVDQVVQGFFRCQCRWRKSGYLPPDPRNPDERDRRCPKKASNLAIAVQGRSAGLFSRFLSFLIDEFLLTVIFGLGVLLVNYIIKIFKGDYTVDDSKYYIPIIYFVFTVCYYAFMLAALGRSIGKVIMGLLVVGSHGKQLTVYQAFARAVLAALFVLLVAFSLLGLFRRDRRGFQDLLVCTTVVYAWDAERFKMHEEIMPATDRLQPVYATVIESKHVDTVNELDP